MRWTTACSLAVVAAGAAGMAHGQDGGVLDITLELDGVAVADAAAQLADQAGVPVLVAEHVTGTVTLQLEGVDLETAVRQVAEAVAGSWLRTYVVEPQEATPEEYSASDLLGRLRLAWRDWLLRRSDEELAALRERAGPGSSVLGPAQVEQTPTGGTVVDVVRMVSAPFHEERVTLDLQDVPFRDALDAFTLQSGYLALAPDGVDGVVQAQLTDQPVDEALSTLCRAAQATCRRVYVIGQPQELTPDEVEQWFARMLEHSSARFWQMPPEQRRELVQRAANRMDNLPEDVRQRIGSSPWAPRVMQRVVQYVTQLTPEQRREVAPLLQAFGRLVGQ